MPAASRRKSLYVVHPPYPAPARASVPCAQQPAEKKPVVAETSIHQYHVAPAWTDTNGRVRTWSLRDPEGNPLADITTRRGAEKLADLLNRTVVASAVPTPTP